MKSWEKAHRPRKKLKRWQIIALVILSALFISATIVFFVLWKDAIFSQNVMIISLLIIGILWFGFGTYVVIRKK